MTVVSSSNKLFAGQLRAELSRRALSHRVSRAGLALGVAPPAEIDQWSTSQLLTALDDCTDDRIEIDDAPQAARDQFVSIAAVIPVRRLTQRQDGQWVVKSPLLHEYYPVTDSERFRTQPIAAIAAASLLSDRVVFTAWHVATSASILRELRFVFGYKMNGDAPVTVFPADDVYEATHLWSDSRRDIAAFQLDRAVPSTRPPLARRTDKVGDGEQVYVIGHPVGLPAKFANDGQVLDNSDRAFFTVDLDVMKANSGSPVISAEHGDVVGVVSSGGQGWTTVNGRLVSEFCHDPDDVPIEISRISNLRL